MEWRALVLPQNKRKNKTLLCYELQHHRKG
ncbi:hypothetical protein NC651_006624 [Populus alba x Populus x berolinensis]|nr:hypothetical protein NC651_006624 [Populus alba x Populus x berolinensis]